MGLGCCNNGSKWVNGFCCSNNPSDCVVRVDLNFIPHHDYSMIEKG